MSDPIEAKALRTIKRAGRGWAFSQRDLVRLGSREAIDKALQRLSLKSTTRRVIRGIYDYPRFSKLLDQELSPDTDQVAQALARKFGWRIQPSGPAAQNIIGLSAQVPARIVYLSDGPERSYQIGKTSLIFEHTALKEGRIQERRKRSDRTGAQVARRGSDHDPGHSKGSRVARSWNATEGPRRHGDGYRLGLYRDQANHAGGLG